ncbi:ABC transporter ATP-binding protein [Deinococcus maricopensis]|uniref:Sulfate-transporting ATPase n=1 Tax=Deinococcus maricopensis (strain DSM 21211 / LMG 22137 / NRRL B-23946 / LB-34) TaxID=709986 RepID=E8U6L8_DEIML|nr:ABC transporter ATP-binding protein [Deinococcus maricopensis]ADV66707.1 Sulfate-transporting ATPase [Deinococcus maricopensis DSM 21211]
MTTTTLPAHHPARSGHEAISLQSVRKRYGTLTALDDLTLSVRTGELVALLGPNGAGKTTAISLMLGQVQPDAGHVQIFGADPRAAHVRARIGAMLQDVALPDGLSVRELLTLAAALYPRPLGVDAALDLADLRAQANMRAGRLSGGQTRRLSFALAIVGDPDVLFLDEPTVAMDVQSREAFWNGVHALRARGRTVLLTTHYLEEADRAADRIVVMNAGRVVADGTPAAVRASVGVTRVVFTTDLDLTGLRSLPHVESARLDEQGRAHLTSREPEALLAHLFARGVTIRDLEVARASLEDAFLTLTRTSN